MVYLHYCLHRLHETCIEETEKKGNERKGGEKHTGGEERGKEKRGKMKRRTVKNDDEVMRKIKLYYIGYAWGFRRINSILCLSFSLSSHKTTLYKFVWA